MDIIFSVLEFDQAFRRHVNIDYPEMLLAECEYEEAKQWRVVNSTGCVSLVLVQLSRGANK